MLLLFIGSFQAFLKETKVSAKLLLCNLLASVEAVENHGLMPDSV